MLSLNQIIRRIRQVSLAHQQVRNFYFGQPTDFLTDKTTVYASAFLQDVPGTVDLTGKALIVGFKLFLLDLVNVSARAKENELDVQSDMLSVGLDLLAEFDHSSFTDWKITLSNPVTLVREELDDLVAGAVFDFSVLVPYDKDTCAVPTETLPGIINQDDMKLVYDMKYVATGAEGTTVVPTEAVGKKVLLVIRENNPLHKVSNLPDSAEFTWDDAQIELNPLSTIQAGERFLILYRNY